MTTGMVLGDDEAHETLNEEAAGPAPTPAEAPVPVSRRDRRTARTRQAIVDAARELIDEQGYAETTVDQIAERADVAARTFFRHFPSKEAVLFSHFEEQRRLMLELMTARPADEHPFRSVLEGLGAFCASVADQRERFAWAFQVLHDSDLGLDPIMFKSETCDRVTEFIAGRLGVDPAHDARPHAWAMVALNLFGSAMRRALEPGGTGEPGPCFRTLIRQTSDAFERSEPHAAG
jgi:AcrR family transcriptional regulator